MMDDDRAGTDSSPDPSPVNYGALLTKGLLSLPLTALVVLFFLVDARTADRRLIYAIDTAGSTLSVSLFTDEYYERGFQSIRPTAGLTSGDNPSAAALVEVSEHRLGLFSRQPEPIWLITRTYDAEVEIDPPWRASPALEERLEGEREQILALIADQIQTDVGSEEVAATVRLERDGGWIGAWATDWWWLKWAILGVLLLGLWSLKFASGRNGRNPQ